jgi:hypothetical protein
MSRMITKAQNRILKQRIDKKFVTPEDDTASVRVQSGGVVAVGNASYKSETNGIKPGKIVEAVNIGTAANAKYVAKFGNSVRNFDDLIQSAITQTLSSTPISSDSSPEPFMTVTPTTNITVTGFVGSTFTGSQVYTLTNTGTVALNWSITHAWSWVDLTSSTGSLAIGANTTITVSIDEVESAALAVGAYTDMIVFNVVAA